MAFIFQVTPMDQLSKSPNQGLKREIKFRRGQFCQQILTVGQLTP
jgi:hypothetical protein